LLGGVPLVVRVYRAVEKSALIDELFVATDDPRIASAVKENGGKTIMTSSELPTGSDRAAEAVSGIDDVDRVINIQGDEPFMPVEVIDSVIGALETPGVVMSTACAPFSDQSEADNPDIVKVVLDKNSDAIYFSRSRIPFQRSGGNRTATVYRHIGIYGFKAEFLRTFAELSRMPLEISEDLEQLRALEHGFKIRTMIAESEFPGIDTEKDLIRAEDSMERTKSNNGR